MYPFPVQTMPTPNILYLHSHDTGRYIQPYGHAVATPNLQGLAQQGVLFRQNFCVSPTCSPSRAALLTGSYPHENGMAGLAHRGFALNDYHQHMLHTLRALGYEAVLAGVQHIAARQGETAGWQVIGYDRRLEGPQEQAAVEFLSGAPSQPFFLDVGFEETHREYPPIAGAPDDPRYCLPPAPLPDTPATRQDMARFKASARELDRKMGLVLAALEASGLAENTLVICTTDHGIAFPRMKCNLHDSGIGVSLILRGPGGFSGGKVVDAMTSHLDLFPTVCDLLGIAPPAWLRGKSLLPLVEAHDSSSSVETQHFASEGETQDIASLRIHDELFFEVNYHAAYEPMRAVRTPRWKYIRRYDGRTRPVMPNCDDGESKSVWLEHGWRERPVPEEALFDLVFDPNETANLAPDPRCQPVLEEMRARLARWMQATDDPLLRGEIPAPLNVILNDPDGLSPKEMWKNK
jgi:N-sulfoglucosamine sulfohydrolase